MTQVLGAEESCLQAGTGRIKFGRVLIKIVCSKKGFPFHSIVLSLAEVGSRSMKDELRKAAHFKLLVFFVSFFRSFLEVSVLPFLKFDIPFECYDVL